MISLASYEAFKNSSLECSDVMTMAERELSAFFSAVKEMFGGEEAELSAEEWLREVNETADLPGSSQEWRSITTKVLARLAGRLGASSLLTSHTV